MENVSQADLQNIPSILIAEPRSACNLAGIKKGSGLSHVISSVVNGYDGSPTQTKLSNRGLCIFTSSHTKEIWVWTRPLSLLCCSTMRMQNCLH